MIKRLANWLHESKQDYQVNRKRRKILSTNPQLKKVNIATNIRKQYKNYWLPLGKASVDWLSIYVGTSGIIDPTFIPENLYYTKVEPRLNNLNYVLAYSDKNFYENYIPNIKGYLPKTYLRKINGVLLDADYNYITVASADDIIDSIEESSLILKPASESSGGRNVHILNKEGNMLYHQNNR